VNTSYRSLALFVAFASLCFRPQFLSAVELKLGDVLVAAPDFRSVTYDPIIGGVDIGTMRPALWKVDAVTGAREIVTSKDLGGGGELRSVSDVVVDRTGRITIADAYSHAVYQVDPATGFRTALYDGSASSQDGPTLSTVSKLALGNDNSILVADHRDMSVIRIDPVTGVRQLITGAARGDGPLAPINNLAVSPAGDIWLTTFSRPEGGYEVVKVDPETGDRILVSDFDMGGNYASLDARGFLVLNDRTALASTSAGIIQIDLTTGNRRLRGWTGPLVDGLYGIAKSGTPVLFAVGETRNELYRIDLLTNRSELLSGPDFPAGPVLRMPQQVYVYTPEPSSFALLFMVTGVGGLLAIRRRIRPPESQILAPKS
jgi:hypothetical protein